MVISRANPAANGLQPSLVSHSGHYLIIWSKPL
jgi:hypothetical protein